MIMLRETKTEIDPLGYSVDTLNIIWASSLIGRIAIAADVVFESHLAQFYKSIGIKIQVNKKHSRTSQQKQRVEDRNLYRECKQTLILFKKLQIFEKPIDFYIVL